MFKKAYCVELHDQQVALWLENWFYDRVVEGRPEFPQRTAFTIPMLHLIRAFKLLGLGDPVNINTHYKELVDVEFNIQHEYNTETTSNVKLLECEVVGPSMINIRLHTEVESVVTVNEITYSGSFTIYWIPDQESDSSIRFTN